MKILPKNYPHVRPDNPEWESMWKALSEMTINTNQPDPFDCDHEGERWQYMGTWEIEGKPCHSFRHRCHPSTNERINLNIPATETYTKAL